MEAAPKVNSREDYTPSNRRRKGRIFRGTFVPRRGRRKSWR